MTEADIDTLKWLRSGKLLVLEDRLKLADYIEKLECELDDMKNERYILLNKMDDLMHERDKYRNQREIFRRERDEAKEELRRMRQRFGAL